MSCGCGREVPVLVLLRAKVTGKNLVCSECGARGKPIARCGGCEGCDGEGGCRLCPHGISPVWNCEDCEHRREERESLFGDWIDAQNGG
jgi:hypothetical protein